VASTPPLSLVRPRANLAYSRGSDSGARKKKVSSRFVLALNIFVRAPLSERLEQANIIFGHFGLETPVEKNPVAN